MDREKTYKKISQYWHDPVWSKVIAAAVIFILSSIYFIIKSFVENVSLGSVLAKSVDFLTESSKINNLIILICLLLLSLAAFSFIRRVAMNIKKTGEPSTVPTNESKQELPHPPSSSTVFFAERIADAFPGTRGLEWISDSKKSVSRLAVLLPQPLHFKVGNEDSGVSDPIWWFRGDRNFYISEFKKLSKTKVLLDNQELEIKRIAAYQDNNYYRSFVYVETKGQKQTGLHNFTQEDIEEHIDRFGYSWEEFGLIGNKLIRREQFDDGGTLVRGKIVKTTGAELRIRYLTDYNFIIAAKESPYNDPQFDRELTRCFDDILLRKKRPEDLFDYLSTFEKNFSH